MFVILQKSFCSLPLFLLVCTSQTCGSSLGFQEFVKHHEGQTFGLPRLYEPVPKHVPELTNGQLIRLWETSQFSPILRDPNIEKQLCEAVMDRREVNPARFDFYHPTLGKLISNPEFFQYALFLYNKDTARFVHYHHHLIPFIRGCFMMMEEKPPEVPPIVPEVPPIVPEMPMPPISTGIPEPSSFVLLLIGLFICIVTWGFWRQHRKL
jgi:hypothetical protein